MKRILKNITNLECALCYFDADGKKISKGNLTGDVSGLTGNVRWLLRGDVSGLTGNVSGLRGDVDKCEITSEDREKGVSISDLVSD